MAEIDPDVQSLLSSLLETPLAPLGEAIFGMLLEEETARGEFGDPDQIGRERGVEAAAPPDETRRDRGVRQLELAHQTISRYLKRQLMISQRLRQLAPELRLNTIIISLVVRPEEDGAAPAASANLLSKKRDRAIHDFLKAWNKAQSDLRRRWERRGVG